MTRDDMIRMAREAGWEYADNDRGFEPLWAFAALVAAHEREACARACEGAIANAEDWDSSYWDQGVQLCVSRIRARGEKT